MTEWVYGVDASFSRVTREDFRRLRDQFGVRVFVQCLWTGGYQNNAGVKAVAEPNLSDAAAEGIVPAGYANTSPFYGSIKWWSPEVSLAETKKNAGGAWSGLTVVSNDVEIRGVTERCIRETQALLKGEGKRVPYYTAQWFWSGVLGNPQWPWLLEDPLWNAYYDGDPDIDFRHAPYGPWAQGHVIGEQYKGTTDIGGDDFDLNFFDLDYFRPPAAPQEEDFMTALSSDEQRELYNWVKGLKLRLDGFQIGADQLTAEHHLSPEDMGYVGVPSFVEMLWRQRDIDHKVAELYRRLVGWVIKADQLTPEHHLGPEDKEYVGVNSFVEMLWRLRDIDRPPGGSRGVIRDVSV